MQGHVHGRRRALTALLTGAAILTATLTGAGSAQAARANVWANVFYNAGCSTGGFSAFSTGAGSDRTMIPVERLRYSDFAGGNRHAHGAWMTHIGSVEVQPWAHVILYDVNRNQTPFTNDSGVARCFPVDSSKTYQAMLILGA